MSNICTRFSRIVGELLPSVHAPDTVSGLAKPVCSYLCLSRLWLNSWKAEQRVPFMTVLSLMELAQ